MVKHNYEKAGLEFKLKRFGDSSRWAECMSGFPTFFHPPGKPHLIVDIVNFLASDLSACTTGIIITVDDGHTDRRDVS